MPEPLSIVTGVASLLQSTWTVSRELKKFYDGVVTVNQSVEDLRQDVDGLSDVLESMRTTFAAITAEQHTETGHVASHWSNVSKAIVKGKDMLDQMIEVVVEIGQTKKFLDGTRKQFRLNMAEEKLTAFRLHIRSFQDGLQLSLATIILTNQDAFQKTTTQVLPNLDQLARDVRKIARDLDGMKTSQNDAPNLQEKIRAEVLDSTRECVQSAATIISSASTMASHPDGDKRSVVAESNFGTFFKAEQIPAISRYMKSTTVYGYEEMTPQAPPQSVANVPAWSDESDSTSDTGSDVDTDLADSLLEEGKQEAAAGHTKTAEALFHNCLSRLPAPASGRKSHLTTHLDVLNCLFDIHKREKRWPNAQEILSRRIEVRKRTGGVKGVDCAYDVYLLAWVMHERRDLVDAQLHARRAWGSFKKLKEETGIRRCLLLLIAISTAANNEGDVKAYTVTLKRMGGNPDEGIDTPVPSPRGVDAGRLSTLLPMPNLDLTPSPQPGIVDIALTQQREQELSQNPDHGHDVSEKQDDSAESVEREDKEAILRATQEVPTGDSATSSAPASSKIPQGTTNKADDEVTNPKVDHLDHSPSDEHSSPSDPSSTEAGPDTGADSILRADSLESHVQASSCLSKTPTDMAMDATGRDRLSIADNLEAAGERAAEGIGLEESSTSLDATGTDQQESKPANRPLFVPDSSLSTPNSDFHQNINSSTDRSSPAPSETDISTMTHCDQQPSTNRPQPSPCNTVRVKVIEAEPGNNPTFTLELEADGEPSWTFYQTYKDFEDFQARLRREYSYDVQYMSRRVLPLEFCRLTYSLDQQRSHLDEYIQCVLGLPTSLLRLPFFQDFFGGVGVVPDEPTSWPRTESILDVMSILDSADAAVPELNSASLAEISGEAPTQPRRIVDVTDISNASIAGTDSQTVTTSQSVEVSSQKEKRGGWHRLFPTSRNKEDRSLEPPEQNLVRKVVVVGDGCVGKTYLQLLFTTGNYPSFYCHTVFDNYAANIEVDGNSWVLGLFDTAGAEDYDRLRPISYPSTDVFIIVFAIDQPSSFENIEEKWLPEILHHCPRVPYILVATKKECRYDPEAMARLKKSHGRGCITPKEGEELRRRIGAVMYLECSALMNEGVREVFECATRVSLMPRKKVKKWKEKKR